MGTVYSAVRSQAIRVCAELAGKYPQAAESYSLTGHSNPFPAGERLTDPRTRELIIYSFQETRRGPSQNNANRLVIGGVQAKERCADGHGTGQVILIR